MPISGAATGGRPDVGGPDMGGPHMRGPDAVARHADWPPRVVRGLGALVLLGLVVICTPLPERFAAAFAVHGQPAPAEAIVVLGVGATPDGVLTSASLARLVQGVVLYRRGLAPVMILTGGGKESNARAAVARDLGVPADAIVRISAMTTADEAQQVRRRLGASGEPRILVVTNAQHLRRATAVFERAGHRVIPVAAETELDTSPGPEARLGLLRVTIQELFARAYYHVVGYL